MSIDDLKKFMEPRSVALFGVSRRTGEGSYNILENLLSYGYEGRIQVVNPNTAEILGVRTYPSIRQADGGIDVAVINLPRHLVPGIVGECAQAGIRAVVIATQGFADANDEEGKRLQGEIDRFVNEGRVRVLGPNSLGTANPSLKWSSSFMTLDMKKLPVGVICQSGIFFGFPQIGLLGKGIDLGNACDVSFVEGLEYFERDPETRVIALHIEGMRDGSRFLKTVSRIARKKPVLAIKTAKSEPAARAAQSHTGSLVGSDAVWEAALRQAGVIRASNIEELTALAFAFCVLPPMRGRRIGLVTGSGGFGIMMVDSCCQNGLQIASLSRSTVERLRALYPTWQSVGNPLDVFPSYMVLKNPFNRVMMESIGSALSDEGVDAVLMMWNIPNRPTCHRFCEIVQKLIQNHPEKPLVFCLTGAYAEEVKTILESAGKSVVLRTPDMAARVLDCLARYSARRSSFQDYPGVDG